MEEDFTLHYRVTETERFLDKLLPVEATTVDTILESMKDQNLYNSQTQRWVAFPDPTHRESESKEKKKPKENLLILWPLFCDRQNILDSRRNSARFFYLKDGHYEMGGLPLEVAQVTRHSSR